MPDTYKFTGKDGVERTFMGTRPPTPAEMQQIEQAEAKPLPPASGPTMNAGWWEDRGIGGQAYHPGPDAGQERTRVDNSVLGMPPEFAAMGVASVAKAAATSGLGAAGRLMAGTKAALAQATPVVKYEVAKGLLEHIGVPGPIAMPVAMAFSGYKRGGGRATPAAEPVAPTAPGPSPAIPTAVPPPVAAAPSPAMSGPPPAPMSAAALPQQAAKLKLTAIEVGQVQKWMAQGLSPEKAIARVQAAKALQQTGPFANLPTDAERARAVAERNATGRWQ